MDHVEGAHLRQSRHAGLQPARAGRDVCLVYHLYEGPIGWEGADYLELGIPDELGQVRRYCALRGLDGIPHWDFYLAVNLFKLAAIAQGAYKRALDGIAPAAALSRGKNVQTRARMAWQLVCGATCEN
jgi:aminoglycoside phosphotransferase (APT) family kinase protein